MRDAMKAVLFDLDDTLFDQWQASLCALGALQKEYACFVSLPVAELEYQHRLLLEELHLEVLAGQRDLSSARNERFRRLLAAHGGAASMDDARQAAESYRQVYLENRRLVPGARPLLEILHTQARIGVVTNNMLAEQQAKIKMLGLADVIDELVTSEETGVAKPDPAIFAAALERLDCRADEAVMVGDAWRSDVLGALAAGIPVVWFNRYADPCPDPARVVEIRTLEPADRVARVILGEIRG